MSGALGTVEVISLNPSSDPVPICMEDLPDIQDISPVSTIVGALGTTFGKGASIKYVRIEGTHRGGGGRGLKSVRSKGGCVNLALQTWPKCVQGGEGV